jgi:hypothetical protein
MTRRVGAARLGIGAAAALLVLVAGALAGSTGVKIKRVGAAKLKWNSVRYRAELVAQLSPGLTWRLGKDGPTRLTLDKLALVGEGALLLPGEMTLNLRYWSQTNWEIVAFAENDWKWSEDVNELGVVRADVGRESDAKKHTKDLELELRATTKAKRAVPPRPAVTGHDVDMLPDDENANEGELTKAARKEFDTVPVVELHMRFGPHYGMVTFDAVKPEELRGKRAADAGTKAQKLRLTYARHPAVLARTEWLELHEGQLTFAVMDYGAPGGRPVVLGLSGGEEPALWPVTRKGAEELDPIWGKRVETKTTPKTLEAELDGSVLTIHLAKLDYVFQL